MPLIPRKYHQRTIDRVHLLVRQELANPLMTAPDVARLAGLTPQKATILRMTPLYRSVHNQYMSGVLADLDLQVKENYSLENSRKVLEFSVPMALQALVKQVTQTNDLKVQNKAANDILDRHGRFAKVTRVGLPTGEQDGAANKKDNDIAAELIKATSQPIPEENNQQQLVTETIQ